MERRPEVNNKNIDNTNLNKNTRFCHYTFCNYYFSYIDIRYVIVSSLRKITMGDRYDSIVRSLSLRDMNEKHSSEIFINFPVFCIFQQLFSFSKKLTLLQDHSL